MATAEDLDAVIEGCQQAMHEFGKGIPNPCRGCTPIGRT
jgi:hypothetical protein